MKEKNVKKIGLVIGIILFIGMLAGFTYAFYQGSITVGGISGIAGCFDIDYVKGNNVNGDLLLYDESEVLNEEENTITIKNGMAVTNVSAGINNSCNIDAYLTINLTANTLNDAFISGESIGALKYIIAEYDPNDYPTVNANTLTDEMFDIIISGSVTTRNKKAIYEVQLPNGTMNNYLIIFYIDGDLAMNDVGYTTFSASVEAVATQGNITAAQYISNLYKYSNKTQVIHNNINYNYAPSVGLMNDRLGGITGSLDDGNIRYYGSNPYNYIYFGDYSEKKNWQKWWYETEESCNSSKSERYQRYGFSNVEDACSDDNFSSTGYQMFGFPSSEACYENLNCSINWENFGFENEEECNTILMQELSSLGFSSADEACSDETIELKMYQYEGFESLQACYESLDCSINWEDMGFENEASCNAAVEPSLHEMGYSSVEEACNSPLKNYKVMGYDTSNSCLANNDCSYSPKNYEISGYNSSSECFDDYNCSANWEDWGYDSEQDCTNSRRWYESNDFPSVEEACSNDTYKEKKLWRIVGLFKNVELSDGSHKDLIKVVKNESIGDYSWDTSSSDINSGYGVNNWSQADLMKLLNPGYSGINGSLWYNHSSGMCYVDENNATDSCDFSVTGLSDSVKSKVAEVKWNLGGINASPSFELFPNQVYEFENGTMVAPGNSLTWTGKIALPYLSDYDYATSLMECESNSNVCGNWIANFTYYSSWFLPSFANDTYNVWFHSSYIDSGRFNTSHACHPSQVYPTMYLTPELSIVSGSGKDYDPYVIK